VLEARSKGGSTPYERLGYCALRRARHWKQSQDENIPLIIDTVQIPPAGVRNPIPAMLQDLPPAISNRRINWPCSSAKVLMVCRIGWISACDAVKGKGTGQRRFRSPDKPDRQNTSTYCVPTAETHFCVLCLPVQAGRGEAKRGETCTYCHHQAGTQLVK